MIPVLKKLASLLLSLLLCLSLLSGQARAADAPEDVPPVVQTEALKETPPENPEGLVMPAAEEFPEGWETDHSEY